MNAKEQGDLQNAFSRYAILNEVSDKIFDIIPSLIEDKNFLDNIEKCINIIHKIKEIKEGDLL